MVTKEDLRKMCYRDDGSVKLKTECRADMINRLILTEMMDIDEAENMIDSALREFNLWNEPTLEELFRDDEPEDTPGKK